MLVFIEAPIQCVLLNALAPGGDRARIFVVRRKGWPTSFEKFKKTLPSAKSVGELRALLYIVLGRCFSKDLVVGSHLGTFNRLLICLGSMLSYRIQVLDDGVYSVHEPDWMIRACRTNSAVSWPSFFYRSNLEHGVHSYCLLNFTPELFYKDTWFLVLSDFSGLGVSVEREQRLIEKVLAQARNESKSVIVLPHRRGRFKLYEKLKVTIGAQESVCFEDWYLRSEFVNCRIFCGFSSIWRVLEDHRLDCWLLDMGLASPRALFVDVIIDAVLEV